MAGPLDNKKILQKVDQLNQTNEENSKQISDVAKSVEKQSEQTQSFFQKILEDMSTMKSKISKDSASSQSQAKQTPANDVAKLEAKKEEVSKSIIDKIIDGVKSSKSETGTPNTPATPSIPSVTEVKAAIDPTIIQFLQDYNDNNIEDGVTNLIKSLNRIAKNLPDGGLSKPVKPPKKGEEVSASTESLYPDFTKFSISMNSMLNAIKNFKFEDIQNSIKAINLLEASGIQDALIDFYKNVSRLSELSNQEGSDVSQAFDVLKTTANFVKNVESVSLKSVLTMKKFQVAMRMANPAKVINDFYGKINSDIDTSSSEGIKVIFDGLGNFMKTLQEIPDQALKAKLGVEILSHVDMTSGIRKLFSDFLGIYDMLKSSSMMPVVKESGIISETGEEPTPSSGSDNAFQVFSEFVDNVISTVKKPFMAFDSKFIKDLSQSMVGLQIANMLAGRWKSQIVKLYEKITTIELKKKEQSEGSPTIDSVISGLQKYLTSFSNIFDMVEKIGSKSIKSVVSFSFSMTLFGTVFKKMESFNKKLKSSMTDLNEFFDTISKISEKLQGIKTQEYKNEREKSQTISGIGAVIDSLKLVPGIIIKLSAVSGLTNRAVKTINAILRFVTRFNFMKVSNTKIRRVARSLMMLSTSILSLVSSIVMASIIAANMNLGGLVIMGTTIGLMFLLISKFGSTRQFKKIIKAGLAMQAMGLGLMSMAIGMVVSSKLFAYVDWKFLMIGFAASIAMLLIMNRVAKSIIKITLATVGMALMGLAMISLAVGFLALGLVTKAIGVEGILMSLGVMLGVAAVMILISMLKSQILFGVAAVALMGISLIVLSLGLMLFFKTIEKLTIEQALEAVGVLAGTAAIFAAIGIPVVAGAIALGAVAMMLVGASLLVLSAGLWAFFKVDFPSKEKMETMFDGTTEMVKLFALMGVASILIVPGAIAMMVAAPAMILFAEGLKAVNRTDVNIDKIDKFNAAIKSITSTMAEVSLGQSTGGFFGNLIAMAVPWAKSPVRLGAESVSAAGKALISIAEGLKEFDSLTRNLDLSSYDEKGVVMPKPGSLGDKIRNVVNMLNASFSAIGASGNSGFSVAKMLFGADLKPADAEVGIKSVLKSGEALKSIAEGLLAFDQMAGNLNFVDDLSPNPTNLSIQQKISKIVGMIHTSFAAIGQSANEGSSVMKNLFGVDFKKSDTEEGINAVKDIGKVLTEIADGIRVWADLDTAGIPIEKIGENIGNIVTVISKQFGDIGKMQKSEGHWLWGGGQNPVAEGIQAVSGIGGVLSGVADGIKVFANLKEIGITEKDFDGEAPGSISNNIKRIINLIADIFAEIGGGVVETEVGGSGTFKFPKAKAKLIKDGIESITGVGQEIKNIADSVKVFAETNIDTEKVKTQLKSIVESLTQTFAEFGSGKTIKPEAVENGVKAIKGLGQELKPIIESYKPIMEMSKDGNIDVNKIRNMMKSMLVDTVTIFAAIGGDDKSWKKMFPNDEKPDFNYVPKSKKILEDISGSSEILTKIVDSVSKIKSDDWENQKTTIKDLFRVPVLALKDVSDMYAANTGQMNASIQLYPRLNSQVDSVSNTIKKIDTNILAKNPISNLTKDFSSFLSLAKDPNLKPKPLEALGTMVSYLERLSNIQNPFDRFQKSFREYVKDFKDYVEQINKMDIESMKQINKFTELTTEYIKVKNVGMEDKLESIKLLLQEIVQASANMFQAQANVFSENPNLASQVAAGQTNVMAPTPVSQNNTNAISNETLDRIYNLLSTVGIRIKT